MEIKFDYSISDKIEKEPVGQLKFLYSGEIIEYYSEQKLLKDYKESIYSQGIYAVKVKINGTKENPRHGLRYEITNEEAGEFGTEYTKNEYERDYKKSLTKKEHER